MMFTILPGYGPGRILRAPGTVGLRIGFLGPEGTFTEEALLVSPTTPGRDHPFGSLVEVLDSVQEGQVDLGFVPLENAIEGTVRDIIDSLVFDFDLRIQREVVLDIHLHLMAPPGTALRTSSGWPPSPWPPPSAGFLTEKLPGPSWWPPTPPPTPPGWSASATRPVVPAHGGHRPPPGRHLYGLEILVEDVEDHPDNQTRFVSVARTGIPAPTGHDRTSIACFQSADHPGSLYAILGHFAARNINLTKLESRPTKQAPRRLLLHHRLRGPRRRRRGRRLPARPPRRSWPGSSSSAPTRRRGRPGRPSGPRPTTSRASGPDLWLDGLRAEVRARTARD
jgi:prephenate dehydratase